MKLVDVNVLVGAFHTGAAQHDALRGWLGALVAAQQPFGVSELVLGGFIRVATHPRVFDPPAPLADALSFAEALRAQPNAIVVRPGPRHWELFAGLCRSAHARGSLVADAYHAALAIESGCEWITMDGDFARFAGLRWRHPFEAER